MSGQHSEKAPVTFCDVVASFSMEEWRLLHDWQKELYKNVMSEIQKALVSLGPLIAASIFSLSTEEKEAFFPVDSASSEACGSVNYTSESENKLHRLAETVAVKSDVNVNCESNLPSELARDKTHCLQEQPDKCQWESNKITSRVQHKDSAPIRSFLIKEETETECLDRLDFQAGKRLMKPADLETCYVDNPGIEVDDNSTSITTESRRMRRQKEGENTLKYEIIQPSGTSEEIERLCVLQNSEKRVKAESQLHSAVNPLLDGEDTLHCESVIGEPTYSVIYNLVIPNVEIPAQSNDTENVFGNPKPFSCQQSANPIKTWHVCKDCEKGFSKRRNLLRHQKRHLGAKLYDCSDCAKNFSLEEHLILHQRTHIEGRLYHCDLCEQMFSKQKYLDAHKRIHERERPYECTKCGKRFTCKRYLRLHTRSHTGEKPYQCNVCRKSFSQNSNLNSHKKTHTGEKPFHCSKCEKSFCQKVNLLRHETVHARREQKKGQTLTHS